MRVTDHNQTVQRKKNKVDGHYWNESKTRTKMKMMKGQKE